MPNPIQIKDALGVVIFKIKNFVFPDGEVGTAPVLHGPDGTPLFTEASPGHVSLDAQAAGLASDAKLELIRALLAGNLSVTAPSGQRIPVDIGSATVTISGPVTVSNEVEVKNDAANPLPVKQGGSTGTDFSSSPAAVSGTPLLTIPANPGRAAVEVQNQSAAQLQLVRDDGAGGQVSSILLASGGGAGQQGGGWSSSTFKGRVRVYGPAGSQIGAYED